MYRHVTGGSFIHTQRASLAVVASLPLRAGARLLLGRAIGVGEVALEGPILERESSPWEGHRHMAAVSITGASKVAGDEKCPLRPQAGLFSKQGRVQAKGHKRWK